MTRWLTATALVAVIPAACAPISQKPGDNHAIQEQVHATELAFAKTMADRDYPGFTGFLAGEAIFISGPKPLHGKDAVAAAWRPLFEKPVAPFSWSPEQIEVLDSGTLAWSSGPVFDQGGKKIATFNSIWRLDAPGVWRIVFDKGTDVCNCAGP